MKKLKLIFTGLVLCFLMSCSSPSPKDYFSKAALNSNLITTYYHPRFFGEILELKKNNRLTVFKDNAHKSVTAEEYLKNRLPDLSKNLSEVKSLKKTDDTAEMLEASIAYFEKADQIFTDDYPRIAKLIDENKPQAEIQAEIDEVFSRNDPEMFQIQERLSKAADIYAKENNLPLLRRP